MGQQLKEIDLILSLLDRLDEKEKDDLRARLGMLTEFPPICQKNGHKYKVAGTIPERWFSGPKQKLFCERCGVIKTV